MLIDLILEGKVSGRIDQVAMRLELDRQSVLFFVDENLPLIHFFEGKI